MADEAQHSKSLHKDNDSTQRGCTSSLLIACIVLTSTTALVFGWGLGAPNMYNQYTEPFLKGSNPCDVEKASRTSANQSTTPASAVVVPPSEVDNEDAADENDDGIVVAQVDEDGNDIEEKEPLQSSPPKKSFQFGAELIKGIPQTIFLIGAFIGAVTGPYWTNLFDRKRTVFANYIFCFASSLFVLLAYYFTQPVLFYLSRLFLGYQGK